MNIHVTIDAICFPFLILQLQYPHKAGTTTGSRSARRIAPARDVVSLNLFWTINLY